MTEGDTGPIRGVAERIQAYRHQFRNGTVERLDQEAWMEEKDEFPLLKNSFSIFKPVIESLLHEIKDTYPDLVTLPQGKVQVSTFEPRITESGNHPGHFALIWGSPEPVLSFGAIDDIVKFTSVNERLSSGTKKSKRKKEKFERLLEEYGKREILIGGFNVVVAVADVEIREGLIVPVAKLITNDSEDAVGFTIEEVVNDALIPDLAEALDPAGSSYGLWPFHPRVRTFVTEGPNNIFPTGPFV